MHSFIYIAYPFAWEGRAELSVTGAESMLVWCGMLVCCLVADRVYFSPSLIVVRSCTRSMFLLLSTTYHILVYIDNLIFEFKGRLCGGVTNLGR